MFADGIHQTGPRGQHNGTHRVVAFLAATAVLLSPFVNAQAAASLPETIATATGSDTIVVPARCVPVAEPTPADGEATAPADETTAELGGVPAGTPTPASTAVSPTAPTTSTAGSAVTDVAADPTTAQANLSARNGDTEADVTPSPSDPANPTAAPTQTATALPMPTATSTTATATPTVAPSATPSDDPTSHVSATPNAPRTATPSPSTAATDADETADETDVTAAPAAGCPETPLGVTVDGGLNSATVRWALSGDGAQPTAFYVDVTPTDPAQVAAIGHRVVQVAATLGGRTLDGVTVTGLRNGVEYAFAVYAATAGGSSAPAEAVTATPTTGMEGEVASLLVKFADDAPIPATDAVPGADAVGTVGLALGGEVAPEVRTVDLTEAVTVAEAESIAAALAQDPAVEWAEPDQFVFTAAAGASDQVPDADLDLASGPEYAPGSWQLWDEHGTGAAPTDTNLPPTPTAPGPYAGSGQVVAVIDTGITAHPALAGATVAGYDFVSDPAGLAAARDADGTPTAFDADGTSGWDEDPTDPGDWNGASPLRGSTWHGTAVAGVVAARPGNTGQIAGTAPGARIEPIRALSWRGGLISDIAAGITWASGGTVAGVPANANPAGVVNLSLAVQATCPATLQAAIDGAVARGSVVVAAAGNADDDAANWAPANCAGVITVGATGRDGHRAGYSNWGGTVDMSAPGGALGADSGILTTSNDGVRTAAAPGYRTVEGTSIAAAQVAAAAAIVRAGDPSLSPEQVYSRLTGKTTGFADGAFDPADAAKTGGTGILDMRLAQVAAACAASVQTPSDDANSRYMRITSSCDFTVPAGVSRLWVLYVGGGGGGGSGSPSGAGGGGAGGFYETSNVSVTPGTSYSVTVGGGGSAGSSGYSNGSAGGASSAFGISVSGGGGGGAGGSGTNGNNGGSGGSGGGAGYRDNSGGTGLQGSSGGSTGNGSPYCGAGGGGANASGGSWSSGAATAGDGGSGKTSSITGSNVRYAGGGGGGCEAGTLGSGGSGGGGSGGKSAQASSGSSGYGGGGGGGANNNGGGSGGSGVVIVRWRQVPNPPTGLTVTAKTNSIAVSWTAPTHIGAGPVTGYDVDIATSSTGPWTDPSDTCAAATMATSTATTCAVEGLTPGTTYYVRIATINSVGAGEFGTAVSATVFGPVSQFLIASSGAALSATAKTAGTSFPVVVTAADSGGRANTEWTTPVDLTSTAFTGTVNVPTFASGVSTATGITPTIAGSGKTITMTAGAISSDSVAFTVNPGAASTTTSTITASPATITANGTATSTITVQLKDANGNNLAASGGTLTMTKTAGTLSSVTNNNNGTYTATLTAPAVVGSATITAALAGVTLANTATVTFEAGVASKLSLTQAAPSSSGSGAVFATQPKVTIQDASGNTITTSTAKVTATITSGANGSFVGTASMDAVNGVATFSGLGLNGAAGTVYTIRYASDTLSTVSQTVTVNVGAASALSLTTDAVGAVYNTVFTTQPVVTVKDSGGNTVTSSSAVVTATVKDAGGNVVAASGTTATAASGVATFSGMKIAEDEGTYTIEYTSGSLTLASQTIALSKAAQSITFGTLANRTYLDPAFSLSATADSGLDVTFESRTPAFCTTGGTNGREVALKGAGTCTIRALQAGNGRWSPAQYQDRAFTIAQASQTALEMSSDGKVVYGSTLALATTGGSGGGAVTYSVTAGTCQITGSTLTPGDASSLCEVRATKASSANYLATTSAVQTITVEQATQTITFTSTVPTTPVYTDTYTPAATSTSGLQVSLSIASSSTGICSMAGGIVTFDATGDCTIVASQTGNTNYKPASEVPQVIAIGSRNQSITFQQPSDMVLGSSNQSMVATADSGLTVEYIVGPGTTNGACAVTQFGVVSAVAVGICEILAKQPGDSNWAAASNVPKTFQVTPTVPGSPKIDSVSAGDGKLTVAFTAPSFTGGTAITAYKLIATPPIPGAPVTNAGCSATALPRVCAVTGLTNGLAYGVRLVAVNTQGDGVAGTVSGTFVPVTAAYAVDNLVAIPGDTVLDVSWTAPTNLGGGSFVRYELYLAAAGSAYPTTPSATLTNIADLSHQFTGLSNGTSYDVKVVTITTANNSEIPSITAEVRQFPSTVPGAPASVSILVLTPTKIQVSWSAPASDGGAPLVSPYYEVTVTSTTPGANAPLACTVVGVPGTRECEITGMTNGAIYSIAVKAENRMGKGAAKTTAYTVPGSDSLLRSLVLTQAQAGGVVETLNPTFDPGTFTYAATVPNAVTDVTVTPAVRETGATVQVNGVAVPTAVASGSIPLAVGANTITVDVAAHDPSFTSRYEIVVVRMPAADLARTDVSASPASITANGASTTTVTVALKDAGGNAITRTGGVVAMTTDRGTIGAVTDNGDGTYTATLTSGIVAGNATVSATLDSQAVTDTAVVAFAPDVADLTTSTVTVAKSTVTADSTDSTTVTVTLKDANGNQLLGSAGTVTMATNRGSLGTVTDNNDGTYTATLTSPTLIGTATVTAKLAGSSLTSTATVTFAAGPASTSKSLLAVGASTLTADGSDHTTVTVTLKDAYDNPISIGGQSVQILTTAGSITQLADNNDGTHTATLTSATTVGNATVTAKIGGAALVATELVEFVPGTADAGHSVVRALPTTVTADGQSVVNVTVQARDAHGNNLRAGGSTVTIPAPTGLTGVGSVVDNGDGTYTRQLTAPLVVGQVVIGATLNGTVVGNPATVDFVTGNPTVGDSLLTVSSSSITANGTDTSTVTVTLKDAYGHVVVDATRLVVVSTDLGSVSSTVDNGDGTYTATVTAGTLAGTATVTAKLDGTALTTTRAVTFKPDDASMSTSTITATPTTLTADGTSTADVTVILRDVNSNVLDRAGGVLALTADEGSLSTPAYAGNGIWTATYTAGTLAGPATISGTLDGTAITDPAVVTLDPGAASLVKSVVTANPTTITADGSSTSTITVALKDAYDNVLDVPGGVVTLATDHGTIGTATNSGTGVWTATLTSSSVTGTATVTADLDGNALTDDASVVFAPGAADLDNSTVSVSSGSITANGTSTSTVTVALFDAFNNALDASAGTVVLSTSGGTLSAVTDNNNGTYTATLTSPTTVGTATITATLAGSALTDDATVHFVPGAADASTSALSVSSASITADGTSTSTVTVTLKDAHGNLLTAGGDTVAVSTTAGTLGSVTDKGDGTYTATLTSPTTTSTATVTATVNSATLTATQTVAFVHGAPTLADSEIDTDATAITADGVSTATITVTLKDAHGNQLTASGGTVVIAATGGTIGSVTDNNNGTYTATLTAPSVVGNATVSATLDGSPLVATTSVAFVSGSASLTRTTVTASPTSITANGTSTSTITVSLVDGAGNGLTASGGTVTVFASAGTLGSVTDNADGTYTATLTSPTTAGSATVTAKLDGNALSKSATVAFVPGAASTSTSTLTSTSSSLVANGTASTTVTVKLYDARGNALAASGGVVTLAATRGTLGAVTDNSDGTYTATYTTDTLAAPVTITAKLDGNALTATRALTLVPGPAVAGQSVLSASPGSMTANGTDTSTVTVTAKDANGNALIAGGSTVVVATTRGTVGTVTDNSDGTYTATLTAGTVAGLATLSATLDGTTIGGTDTVDLTPDVVSAAHSTIAVLPGTVVADGLSTVTVTVTAKDVNDNQLRAGGSTVVVSVPAGGGTVGSVTDNNDGTYTATITAPLLIANATVTATIDGIPLTATASLGFVAGAPSPATTRIVAAAGSLTADGTSTTGITVTLKDVNGNVVTTGTWTVALATTHGTVGAVTRQSDGTYTATLTSATSVGTATVTGTLNAVAITDDATVTFVPGAAATATSLVDVAGGTLTADGTDSTTVTVTLKDAFGNLLTAGGDTVALSTTAGMLGSVTDNNDGTYTATLTAPTTAGSTTVSATLGGSAIADTASVSFAPGAASTTTSTVATATGTLVANGATTTTVTVTLKDAFGNTLTTGGATVALSTSAGSVGAVTDNGNGTYSATFTSGTTAATATVSATLAGTAIANTATVSLVPGPATRLVVDRGAAGIASGAAFTTQPRIAVQDAFGNVRGSDNATVVTATVSTGGTLVGTTTATATNGLATFADLGLTGIAGTSYTITYDVSGLTSASEPVTAAVGAPVGLAIVTDAAGAVRGADVTTQPVVRVVDAGGNTVTTSTATVTATVIDTGGVTVLTSTATAAGGVATFAGMRLNRAGTFAIGYATTGLSTANQSLTVARGPQTITFGTLPARTYGDAAFPVAASSDSGLAVTVTSSTPTVCTTSGTNGATVTVLTAGTCALEATQAGDSDYLAATLVARTFAVDKKAQAPLTMTSAATVAFGGSIALASVGGEGNGAVTYATGSGSTCTINGSTLTPGDAGSTCAVTATKAGDANLLPVTSVVQTITVTKAGQQLAFTSAVPTLPMPDTFYTPTVAVTSDVTGQASGLSAVLTVTAGSPNICTLSNGIVSFLATGTCEVTASQTGNGDFTAATPQTQTIVVGSLNQTITFPVLGDANLGDADLQATATASSTLSVTYGLGGGTTNAACTVTLLGLVHIAAVGTCEITASQAGNGKYAAASDVTRSFVVRPGLPSAPTIHAVTSGDASVTVSFTAPGSSGGAPITGYIVTATPSFGPAVTYSACALTSPCTVPGLVNGRTYDVVIAAVNSTGTGAASNAMSEMPFRQPTVVSQFAALPGDGIIDVTWQAPADLGGGTFVEYRVFVRPTGFGAFPTTPYATVTTPSGGNVRIAGLANGDSYDIKVVAYSDLNGTVFVGDEAVISEFASGVPSMPQNLTLQIGAALYVSWGVPVSDGGAPITRYDVSVSTSTPNASLGTFVQVTPTSGYVPDATPGASYVVSVAAVNRMGASVAATTSRTAPVPSPAAAFNAGEAASPISPNWAGWVPEPAFGSVAVYENARLAQFKTSANAANTELTIIGSMYRLELGATGIDGKPMLLDDGAIRAGRGSLVTVGGVGYLPGEQLEIRMVPLDASRMALGGGVTSRTTSPSYALGGTRVLGGGSFSAQVRVPQDAVGGDYSLEITGPSKAASDQTVAVVLRVDEAAVRKAPWVDARRIAFHRMSTRFHAVGVDAIKGLVRSIPADATNVRIEVSSRWGAWDPGARVARVRAQRIVQYLRDTRGIEATYRTLLPRSTPRQVAQLGGVSVRATYLTSRTGDGLAGE